MPHVSVASHHRQPRNSPAWVEPPGYANESDGQTGSPVNPAVFPTIPYTPAGGAAVNAYFAFWSVSDAEHGRTQTSPTLQETVGLSPLTLVAWYFLPGGGGPGGDSSILIDAYSVGAGDGERVTSNKSALYESRAGEG